MILALDYGARYVGVAAADLPDTPIHRYSTIDQKDDDVIESILDICEQESVSKILIGVPIGFSGDETEQTHENLQFIEQLRLELGPNIEVEGVDETLTSAEADRVVSTEGSDVSEQHAEAARLMLVDYLQNLV